MSKPTPREPTPEMLEAVSPHGSETWRDLVRKTWQAMHDAAPSGWQPIETAPKDGTPLLVMRDIWLGTDSGRAESCNGHNTYVAAWWSFEGSDGTGRWVCYMDAVFEPTCPIQPTHWMPLPAPPKDEA